MTKTESVKIHPTAIVQQGAELGRGVEVGPWSFIESTVRIGDGSKIGPRVNVEGHTTIGSNTTIFTGAIVGSITQDKKYKGGKSFLEIGDNNTIREYATLNPGTEEGTKTVVGSGNLLMAYCHIAHDCVVGDDTVLANNATLAGHVLVEDRAIIGGLSAVHQFVRIGNLSIVGGCSKVVQDVPPFMMVDGHPARARGLNLVGIERAGIGKEEKSRLKKAYKLLFRSGNTFKKTVEQMENELDKCETVDILLKFLADTQRGICKESKNSKFSDED